MALLTISQTARIQAVVDYLLAGSAGKHIDDRSVEELARVFNSSCGFVGCCPGTFVEGMRDAPVTTLLRAVLCVDASSGTLSVAETARIQATIDRVEAGSAGKWLDDTSVEELSRVFCDSCGFFGGCPGTLHEGLRDSPWSTLLTLLLCVASGSLVVGFDPGPAGAGPAGSGGGVCEGLWLFGVLAGSTVTNTGATVVDGDLGLSPGTSVTGFPPGIVLGEQHVTDATAAAAQVELTAAYLDLEGRTGATTVAGNIGGQTLGPGLYKSTSSLAISSGELTLDAGGNADATFIFQIASTFTMTSGRQVILAGGAQAKNVYWQVGSSATIGSTAVLQGSILALTSITAVTSAVINGRLLARNGAVTLDTNAVTTPDC